MEDYSFEEMSEILSTPMPTQKSEKMKEHAGKCMDANTQILLGIFEKVVCIEKQLEGEHRASGGMMLPTSSIMLEGE